MNKYEKLRAEYLLNCRNEYGEPCGGEPSAGINPCPYYQAPDVDGETGAAIPGGCLLKIEQDGGAAYYGLNDLAAEIHKNAVDHGWWDEDRGLPEILMLCVSELAEALEEYRAGRPMSYCGSTNKNCENLPMTGTVLIDGEEYKSPCPNCHSPNKKPEGVAVELADCMIRILDYCGRERIDIDALIRIKHEYNKGRPYRHGGKKC